MTRCQAPGHLLPQSAEGAVGACLAVGGELVAGTPMTFLLGAHRESQAALMAVDHEGSHPPRVVLDLFPDREVGIPALFTVPHVVISSLGSSLANRQVRTRKAPFVRRTLTLTGRGERMRASGLVEREVGRRCQTHVLCWPSLNHFGRL